MHARFTAVLGKKWQGHGAVTVSELAYGDFTAWKSLYVAR